MSKVSRSKFQSVVEENKRLLGDIKLLVADPPTMDSIKCMMKWQDKFKANKDFNDFLHQAAKEYIREHASELPNFLTKGIDNT